MVAAGASYAPSAAVREMCLWFSPDHSCSHSHQLMKRMQHCVCSEYNLWLLKGNVIKAKARYCLYYSCNQRWRCVLMACLRYLCSPLQAQGTAAEADIRQQLQQRYSPAAIKAMLELGATASGFSRQSSSSSSRGRSLSAGRPAEAALIAEVPTK